MSRLIFRRDVFKTQPNIYDEAFLCENKEYLLAIISVTKRQMIKCLLAINYFRKKAIPRINNRVLNALEVLQNELLHRVLNPFLPGVAFHIETVISFALYNK